MKTVFLFESETRRSRVLRRDAIDGISAVEMNNVLNLAMTAQVIPTSPRVFFEPLFVCACVGEWPTHMHMQTHTL